MVEDAAAAYGGLDVVYNNAAMQYFGPKFAWPHLVRRGGDQSRVNLDPG
jgi:NAD(P)-dependent dehydrogenase (short-subunit alcohol dehydrogenase family)